MNEAEWQTREKRIDTKLRSLNPAWQIVLETRLTKARGQVENLTPSLLAKAFRGQLVPQDPTDEPVEKLLERIQSKGASRARR